MSNRWANMRRPVPGRRSRQLASAVSALRTATRGSVRASSRYSLPASLRASTRSAGTEVKSMDNLAGTAQIVPFLAAGTISSPFGTAGGLTGYPIEGSGFYNRIGRRIRMKSLQIDGTIIPSSVNTAAVGAQYARILVVYDRQANGAAPAIADVLSNFDESGTQSAALPVFQHMNMSNRDRFMILRDRKVYLPPIGISGATPAAQQGVQIDPNEDNSFVYREYIKLNGLEMHFKASSATGPITDIATGSIFVLCVSQSDANAAAAWEFAFTARLKFLD